MRHGYCITMAFLAALGTASTASCAHSGSAPHRAEPPALRGAASAVIAAGDGDKGAGGSKGSKGMKDPLGTLESALASVKSDRVTVSTALLKSLVKNQRLQESQCKSISGQLEALKNVDLNAVAAGPADEAGGAKE